MRRHTTEEGVQNFRHEEVGPPCPPLLSEKP